LFKIFVPFLAPILWSTLLAFLVHPANERLTRRLKGRKAASAAILTGIAALAVVAPAVILGIVFAGQASDLVARFGGDAQKYHVSTPEEFFRLPPIASAMTWIEDHLPVTAQQMQQWAIAGGRRLVTAMAGLGGSVVVGAMGLVVDLLLTLFLLFYFLRDGA